MDPNTGQFHPLKAAPKPKGKKLGLHPTDQVLVLASNNKPVPKSWPVFRVGERYAGWEIIGITAKDIEFRVLWGATPERGELRTFQGREFRVRVVRPRRMTIGGVVKPAELLAHPLLGKVARC